MVQAGEASRQLYLDLIHTHPSLTSNPGDASKGEIEIITDPEKMALIEQETMREVGVISMDKYWVWINDACRFPNGKTGVYGRIMWVKALDSCPGVAVMPMTSDGKVFLNCNFRHATRAWEIELPRGLINPGENQESAARRETAEETGLVVDELILLGEMPPDTGVINSIVPVFCAKVVAQEAPQREDAEAIEDVLCLSIAEIKQAFAQGYYEHVIRGETKRIPFRDPFIAYAVLMYEIKQGN
jgi:ADP-ribose pyrophosphatase